MFQVLNCVILFVWKGTHIESDLIEMYKVRAVCLRPAGRLAEGHRSIGHMQCSGEELVPGECWMLEMTLIEFVCCRRRACAIAPRDASDVCK